MTEVYDFAAIGAGPAGESAAELAAFYGHRSVVIEKNRPGGTVTTTGGAPTKTLREAALYLTGFRDRNMYGLQMTTLPDVVSPTIRKRTRVVSGLLQRVTADNITKRIPKDILIVGGGPVGAEYATICHASGAHVTLVADRLMPTMDGEMSRRMDDLFRMWGLTVVLSATADTITRTAPVFSTSCSQPARNSNRTHFCSPPDESLTRTDWTWMPRALRPTPLAASSSMNTSDAFRRLGLMHRTTLRDHVVPAYES